MALSGYITSTGAYTTNSNGFAFYSVAGTGTYTHGVCAEMGAQTYCGSLTKTDDGYELNCAVAAGTTFYKTDGVFYSKFSDTSSFTSAGTISSAVLCSLTYSASTGGTVNRTGNTMYGSYAASGSVHKFTPTPVSASYKFDHWEITTGSGTTTSTANELEFTVSDDTTVIAYFTASSYSLHRTISGTGTTEILVNGVEPTWVDDTCSVCVDNSVTMSMTPGTDYTLGSFSLDGTTYTPSSSASSYDYSFTVQSRTDGVYDIAVSYEKLAEYANKVTYDSSLGSVSVTRDGTAVSITNGVFRGVLNGSYTVKAAVKDATANEFVGWYNLDGTLISAETEYTFVQSSAATFLTAKFQARTAYEIKLHAGISTTSYDSGDPAYDAGCSVALNESAPHYSGEKTFIVTCADGYAFSVARIQDDDGTGKTFDVSSLDDDGEFKADISFNASVYVIFRSTTEPEEPEDVDQGNAKQCTEGDLYEWEGSDSVKTMNWASRRMVFDRPVPFSTARVYADGYTDDVPVLKISEFQSPQSSDGKATVVKAKSQSPFRLPLRRAEKYLEVEVTANHQVTEIDIATSMEALWQQQ